VLFFFPGSACSWLSLNDNQLTMVDSLRGLSELRVLNVARNRLTTLSGLCSGCPSLVALVVNDNSLTTLDEILGSKSNSSRNTPAERALAGLNTLVVSQNDLSGKLDFSSLPRLAKLSLSHNRISGLEGFPVTLTELRVSHNMLTYLPPELASCTALRVLDAGNNRGIKRWADVAVLKSLPSLVNVSLRGTQLAEDGGSEYVERLKRFCQKLLVLDGLRIVPKNGRDKRFRRGGPLDDTARTVAKEWSQSRTSEVGKVPNVLSTSAENTLQEIRRRGLGEARASTGYEYTKRRRLENIQYGDRKRAGKNVAVASRTLEGTERAAYASCSDSVPETPSKQKKEVQGKTSQKLPEANDRDGFFMKVMRQTKQSEKMTDFKEHFAPTKAQKQKSGTVKVVEVTNAVNTKVSHNTAGVAGAAAIAVLTQHLDATRNTFGTGVGAGWD